MSTREAVEDLDAATRGLVVDLHTPRPLIFWADLLLCATAGWAAFALAVAAEPFTVRALLAGLVAGLALYRGVCFTHELSHLRRRDSSLLRSTPSRPLPTLDPSRPVLAARDADQPCWSATSWMHA